MSELDIHLQEEFITLGEEDFLREYGQANYDYYEKMLDPVVTEEDMPEIPKFTQQKFQHATSCTEWTKTDQQIHDKDWEEWNKTIT